jgi:hypothetical protein
MKRALLAAAALACAALLSIGTASAEVAAPAFEGPADIGPAKPRAYGLGHWAFSARVFTGYDDNVNFVADGDTSFSGETDSKVVGFTAEGGYHTNISKDTTVGASARIDQTHYLGRQDNYDPNVNDDASEYDLTALSLAGYVEKSWTKEDRRRRIGASYEVTKDDARKISAIGGVAQFVKLYGDFEPNFHSNLGAEVTLGTRDFDVEFGGDPELQRDGEYYALKLHGRYDFDGRRRSVGAYVKAARNDSDGARFRYDSVAIGVTPTFQIKGPLWLNLAAAGEKREYDTASFGPPRTESTIVTTSAQLVLALDSHWTADATVSHLDVDANDRFYEGDRTSFLVGIQVRY